MANQDLAPYFDENGKRVDHYFVDPSSRRPNLGGWIYYMRSHTNRKIKFSTRVREPDILKAKRFANAKLQELLTNEKKTLHPLITDELDLYQEIKESEGLSEDTLYAIRRSVRYIREFWGEKFPHEINRENLTLWYNWWEIHHSDIEIETPVKYLKNFANYLTQRIVNGKTLLVAAPKIKNPKQREITIRRHEKKEYVFSADDFKKIFETAENSEHQLLVLIMYTMATRITETLNLSFKRNIILDEEMPVYRWYYGQNKADLSGEHMLHPVLIERLKTLREIRRAQDTHLLFPQARNNHAALKEQQIDWAEWRKRANLAHHWSPHTFRHTALTNLFNNAKNPTAVVFKQYRVSPAIAFAVYVKVTRESMMAIREAIKVDL